MLLNVEASNKKCIHTHSTISEHYMCAHKKHLHLALTYTHKLSFKVAMLSYENTTGISPSSATIKEGSLSYYFNLPNEGIFSPHQTPTSKHHIIYTSRNLNFLPSTYPITQHRGKLAPSSAKTQSRPLLDADAGGAAPLSWLSALFSKRKKPHRTRSPHACDEQACEPSPAASLEWEPPRASSWEQLSSWEKPSSSLWNLFTEEPHRASEADMQELLPSRAVQDAAQEFDPLMKKQETSSKGWAKSFLTIKWAIKLRRPSKKGAHGYGDDDDRGASAGATSSKSGRSQNVIQSGQLKVAQERAFHSQRELGATWSSHYNSRLQTYGNCNSNLRPSHHSRGDHGLLRFYLAPTRGLKMGGKRPKSHHPLIPEI
ncbi:hypothetical protein GOP47_0014212 [Adiantum capillus-veneris]|uniref:Uncharacterized protein n=1 Tax=Adiantum capillus-veneris TaxID=13818 RepID=A0A9D4UQ91_ADICA|nr:hypothetical protein GOP47_0014212 [Adiantum capillus-veneris]